jgi:hypothetical protein
MVFFVRSDGDLGRRRMDPAFRTGFERCALAAVSGRRTAGGFDVCFICTLKTATGSPRSLDHLEEIARQKELKKVTYITLSIVFWVILGILIVAIAVRYIVQ